MEMRMTFENTLYYFLYHVFICLPQFMISLQEAKESCLLGQTDTSICNRFLQMRF